MPRASIPGVRLTEQPPHACASILAVEKEDYCIYLADERELSEPGAGQAICGDITLALPEGLYRVATFSPVTGLYSPWVHVAGGPETRLLVPDFSHDLVLRIIRPSRTV